MCDERIDMLAAIFHDRVSATCGALRGIEVAGEPELHGVEHRDKPFVLGLVVVRFGPKPCGQHARSVEVAHFKDDLESAFHRSKVDGSVASSARDGFEFSGVQLALADGVDGLERVVRVK